MSSKKYVIVDCDGGSDDAWALLLLLRAEAENKITLLGITISGNGNTDLINATRNILRILKAMNREEIPIFHGVSESLIQNESTEKYNLFHGKDGFADVFSPKDFDGSELIDNIIQREHAVVMIHQFVCKHPKAVTLVGLGPLTNLALCCVMYGKEFTTNVAELYIMGGNYQGVGNITKCSEFNFYMDPEAAYIILMRISCPITILPWEPCMEDRFNVCLNWRMDDFGVEATKHLNAITILNTVEKAQYASKTWNPCDAMLVAAFLCRSVVSKESYWHATVDLNGNYTRGQMILDHLHDDIRNPKNVKIIEKIDEQVFKNVVRWGANFPQIQIND